MSGVDPCPEHEERTRRRGLHYCFYIKHHGGSLEDPQWATDLEEDEEFAIFDEADWHDVSDPKGNLYGLRRSADGTLLDLGTEGEQIAKFSSPDRGQPIHGFPPWPLAEGAPDNRKKVPATSAALLAMERADLLTTVQRKRLQKGRQA